MPRELQPFVCGVVLALAAAWIIAARVILKVGEPGQRLWTWCVTVLVAAGSLGFCALVVLDAARPPRTVTGLVQAVGDAADRGSATAYTVLVDGTVYAVRRADFEKLQVGERIRGRAGAVFNFLQRVDALP